MRDFQTRREGFCNVVKGLRTVEKELADEIHLFHCEKTCGLGIDRYTEFLHIRMGFDHRAGRFRPPDMATGILKLPILQWYRYFYLERRLLGWPTP